MSLEQTTLRSEGKPPWQDREVSYAVKLVMTTGVVLLVLVVILPLALTVLSALSLTLKATRETLVPALLMAFIPLAILGLCIFGFVKLWPYLSAPTRFDPKLGGVAPSTLGENFYVKFERQWLARSFRGDGVVKFRGEQLYLDGKLDPSIAFQIGVIVVVTVIPLVLFGCGLGLIPALVVAYWMGRKEMTRLIPYQGTLNLSVKGRGVSLSCPGESPNRFKFRVASPDGERLYRELQHHLPQAVAEWAPQLRLILSGPAVSRRCPTCRNPLPEGAVTCPTCGQSLCSKCGAAMNDDGMTCPVCQTEFTLSCSRCGAAVAAGDTTCPHCGEIFDSKPAEAKCCPACRNPVPEGADTCTACGQSLCPECGAAVGDDAATCPVCQTQFTLSCPVCGAVIAASDTTCPHCGETFD